MMMARQQHQQQLLLHELLKEDQEPFRLKNYISDKRSQVKNKPTTTLQLRKTKQSMIPTTKKPVNNNNNILCKHACFLSFKNSPKSPFIDFHSPAVMSPCNKSPNGAVFLHIPSRTAALLVEAAMRIQKQSQSNPRTKTKNTGFGLFGSLLKRLKDRTKNKKRVTGNDNKDQASTSNCCSECLEEIITNDFDLLQETRYSVSPFRFSLHQSPPSSTGLRTPEFSSPASSPTRLVKQEKENCESRNSNNVKEEEEDEEDKEQCSPVSTLDAPFEDDGHETEEAEDDDYDLECSFANVQRAKQQLLQRLRRFEELANLDPMELERKLLEGSEGEEDQEEEEYDNDDPFSLYRNVQNVDTFVTQVLSQTDLQSHSMNISTDMKRLVSDLIVEEKGKVICPGNKEVVFGRICNKLDSWKEVEFDTIDMMIELDFNKELNGWRKFTEREEVGQEMECEIFGLLIEELSEEMLYYVLNE